MPKRLIEVALYPGGRREPISLPLSEVEDLLPEDPGAFMSM
ncbi:MULTISPECIES: hypothetical protein [Methanoculleus]|uniref:Uncharacterized protein n=1 Tax=Methanoculleus submarinus TaxID=204050 RepID=A0AAX3E7E6_9EURY|nr:MULTISPECIES: hypothetical protein [Methanoculleus]UYU18037.1 hypothetical protein OH143_10050 [Methanoculleus submarinus]